MMALLSLPAKLGQGNPFLWMPLVSFLGERASSEFIRHGKDSFVIDGIFDIADHQSIQELLESKKYYG